MPARLVVKRRNVQSLWIPGWHPTRLNELLRLHWAKRRKRKMFDAEVLRAEAKCQGIMPAKGKRRVDLYIRLAKGQKRGDEDNWWKSLLDGLVDAGLLVNDSFDWCERGTIVFERGDQPGTTVRLSET